MKKRELFKNKFVSYKKFKFSVRVPEFKIGFIAYLLFGIGYLIFISIVLYYVNTPVNNNKITENPEVAGESIEVFTPIVYPKQPVYTGSKDFPNVTAGSILIVDVRSKAILFEKEPEKKMLPASTTKILTALVALDYYPVDKVLKVNGNVIDGQKMGLVTGEEITVENLLYGLLVYSANDAADVLAYNFPGGRDLFISAMNMKAAELGMEDSRFTNPSGFDGEDHYSTAQDLVRLSLYAMNNSLIRQFVSTKDITVSDINGKFFHKLKNINQLIGTVDGVIGIKTGWTENAKENLITYIKRDNHELIISLLGSEDRFSDTKKLIDWTFSSYSWN